MPRVSLVERTAYEHTCRMMIRVTDINHAGHLGNEALLGLVHEARTHFLKALNFDTIVNGQQRVGLIIADMAVNFKSEAFAHEVVSVDSQIDELSQKSFRLFHRIQRGEQAIALIETGMVAYSYSARQVTDLPVEFISALQEYRGQQHKKEGTEQPA